MGVSLRWSFCVRPGNACTSMLSLEFFLGWGTWAPCCFENRRRGRCEACFTQTEKDAKQTNNVFRNSSRRQRTNIRIHAFFSADLLNTCTALETNIGTSPLTMGRALVGGSAPALIEETVSTEQLSASTVKALFDNAWNMKLVSGADASNLVKRTCSSLLIWFCCCCVMLEERLETSSDFDLKSSSVESPKSSHAKLGGIQKRKALSGRGPSYTWECRTPLRAAALPS